MADPVEMKLLHMITADPARTSTFTWFAKPDYFVFAGAPNCSSPCVQEQFGFAWNHGDVTPDIIRTWLGIVGPGVQNEGIDQKIWSDHTDVRPTALSLVGLKDDYVQDGRVLTEIIERSALPQSLKAHRETLEALGRIYKQINAPVGRLGLASLQVSTQALNSGSASDDSTYAQLEGQLQSLTTDRDAVAGQMKAMLNAAAFNGQPINEIQALRLIVRGTILLARAEHMAALNGSAVDKQQPADSVQPSVDSNQRSVGSRQQSVDGSQ